MGAPDIPWSVVAADFKPEGALRDIYVHDATLNDWEAVLDFIRASYPSLEFSIDGEPSELPATAAQIFAISERALPGLSLNVDEINIACHFFTPTEIEFDLRPEDVTGPEHLRSVVSFLRSVAQTVGKMAVLTMENTPNAIILRADPSTGRVAWNPPS